MLIPSAFWSIMIRSYLLEFIVILGALLLCPYLPQIALVGEIVGSGLVVGQHAWRLMRLR